jgi:SAM-dependent methyltransferase
MPSASRRSASAMKTSPRGMTAGSARMRSSSGLPIGSPADRPEHARDGSTAPRTSTTSRRAILAALALGPADRLLELGCGGGLLLRDALSSGARATGLDHSEDMVALARERAPGAEVMLGEAESLPFEDGSFTAVAMSIVFGFFDRPLQVLAGCHRVLAPAGRLALYTTGPELRGTPAAPEPIASVGHYHTDDQLARLAADAGFRDVRVSNDKGGQLLTARK